MRLHAAAFFAAYRRAFGRLNQSQVQPLEALVERLLADPSVPDIRHAAYILATAHHETAHTYLPVVEAYWLSEDWRRRNLRYYPWHGRGFVQLTWERNYERAGRELGVDLTTDPDAALQPEIAYRVLVAGMLRGWFTGKTLSDYITETRTDYRGARRIVNGTDRARLIAGQAEHFEHALACGLWPGAAPADPAEDPETYA
jgi:putative chitinase